MATCRKLLSAAALLSTLAARAEHDLGVVFNIAAAESARKLGDPACLLVLSDFRDLSGRPLVERLSETGLTANEFFERLDFRNGAHEPTCQRSGIDAFVRMGSPTVFVCPNGCFSFERRDVARASNTLIHEMLHTLGLGENPPTSREITNRVAGRCGLR